MHRILILLTVITYAINSVATLENDELEQLRQVMSKFDDDYSQGNMSKLTTDFKSALDEYGDGLLSVLSIFRKTKGDCGSCYAFSTVAALETYHKRRNGQLIDLSPQQVVDCTRELGNNGCGGGTMPGVFHYASKYAIAPEARYPYVYEAGRCRWSREMGVATDSGYYLIEPGDELALKHAVAVHGPVVVGIPGSLREFRFYKSGVFSHPNCHNPNHAVLVVGYGRDPRGGDYWIVKNSWGTNWGRDGYIYMARNRRDMCHITSAASFPI